MQQQAPAKIHLGAQPKVLWDLLGSRLAWTLLHHRLSAYRQVVMMSYKLVAG